MINYSTKLERRQPAHKKGVVDNGILNLEPLESTKSGNLKLGYLYRNNRNFKSHVEVILRGTPKNLQLFIDRLIKSLKDNVYFHPQKHGLPLSEFGRTTDLHEVNWLETTDDEPTVDLSWQQLLDSIERRNLTKGGINAKRRLSPKARG